MHNGKMHSGKILVILLLALIAIGCGFSVMAGGFTR
jgi:hypothetical protein